MDELQQKLAELLKKEFPGTYGFFQAYEDDRGFGNSQGFLINDGDKQFVLELRPRDEEESFTLYELGE